MPTSVNRPADFQSGAIRSDTISKLYSQTLRSGVLGWDESGNVNAHDLPAVEVATVQSVTSVTGSATISATDRNVIYTGSGGHTETLLAASANSGLRFTLKNKGSGAWTISAAGLGQLWTTAAVNTVILAVGDSIELLSDGSSWLVL